ncbi:hypothetical protein HanIR_Chr17g0851351 [Helianthus annuus]|nr:hypothetical protein HanIR_Chr17g0851351 [Helianthus annuus]
MARPVANVLVVLWQILKIFELTTPGVGCMFCPLLLSFLRHIIQSRTRPRVRSSDLAILVVWMWIGAWRVASIPPSLYLCWFLLSFCSFCTFKLF